METSSERSEPGRGAFIPLAAGAALSPPLRGGGVPATQNRMAPGGTRKAKLRSARRGAERNPAAFSGRATSASPFAGVGPRDHH